MIIAIDLDGTILKYDGWKGEESFGEPIPGAVEALQTLKQQGHTIVIHTCRNVSKAMAEHLRANQIPFDRINVSPVDTRPRHVPHKPPADVYIDDKALRFKGDWPKMLKLLKGFKSHQAPANEWSDEEFDEKVEAAEKILERDER